MPTDTESNQPAESLPNRSVPWGDRKTTITIDGVDVTLASIDGVLNYGNGTSSLSQNQAGYVVNGSDELRTLDTRVIDTPSTYSSISDGVQVVTMETTSGDLGNKKSVGYGVTGSRLEAALRFATGGGNYVADDYTIRILDGTRFSIDAPDGLFIFSAEIVNKPDGYEYSSTAEVNGFTIIGEEDDLVLDRLPDFLDYVEQVTGEQIAEFIERTENLLAFKTDAGTRVEFSGHTVTSRAEAERDISGLTGERAHDRYAGKDEAGNLQWEEITYSLSPDVFEYESGENVLGNRYCYGYTVTSQNSPVQPGGEKSVVKVSRRDVVLSEGSPDTIRFETPMGMNEKKTVHKETIYPPSDDD